MGTSGLGSLLVEEGLLTENDRRTIRRSSGTHGSAFARSIVAMGLMDEDELATFLAERTRFRVAAKDLMRDCDRSALAAIDPPLLERLEVLPLRVTSDTLMVAMADPLDMDTVRQLEFFTGLKVQPVIATFSQIRTCLQKTVKNYRSLSGQLEDFLTNHAVSATRRQKLKSSGKSSAMAPAPQAGASARAAAPSSRSDGAPAATSEEDSASLSSHDALGDDDAASPAFREEGGATDLEDMDSLDDLGGDDAVLDEAPQALAPDPASLGDFDEDTVAAPTPGSSAARAAPVEDLGDFDINGDLEVEGNVDELFGDEGSGGDPFTDSDAAASAAAEGTSGDGLGGLDGGGDGLADLDGDLTGSDELGGLEDVGADELSSSDDPGGLEGEAASDTASAPSSDGGLLEGGDDLSGGGLADDLLLGGGGGKAAVGAGADDELSLGDDLGFEDEAPAKPAAKAPPSKTATAARPAPAATPAAAKPAPAAKTTRKTEDLESLAFDDDPLGAAEESVDEGLIGSADTTLTAGDDAFSSDASGDDAFAAGDDLMSSDDPLAESDDTLMSAGDAFGSGDDRPVATSSDEDLFGGGSSRGREEALADELDGSELSGGDSSALAAGEDPFGDDDLAAEHGEPLVGTLSKGDLSDGPSVGDLSGVEMAADDDLSAFGFGEARPQACRSEAGDKASCRDAGSKAGARQQAGHGTQARRKAGRQTGCLRRAGLHRRPERARRSRR
jgi:hypothetical protein